MTTANPAQTNTRWDEITKIWQHDRWLYGIIGLFAGFIFGIAASDYLGQMVTWFAGGFWNEGLSIAITVIVLDRLNNFRAEQARKEELIFQLGSEEAVVSKQAARLLRHKGWLIDGSLNGANLINANLGGVNLRGIKLHEADLSHAKLIGADLWRANLKKTDFEAADLKKVDLSEANLQFANLILSNLQNANLRSANLEATNLEYVSLENSSLDESILIDANIQNSSLGNASLIGANLQRANLRDSSLQAANLSGANLEGANLSLVNLNNTNLSDANLLGADLWLASLKNVTWEEKLPSPFGEFVFQPPILPDGTKWTEARDMGAFTDPKHPDFAATLERINKIREEMGLARI